MNNKNKNNQDSPITPIKLGKNNNPADPGWSVKKSNSKRNLSSSSSSEPPTSPTTQSTNQKILRQIENEVTNSVTEQIDIDTDVNAQNKPPPPVFVKGVEDFPELCARLIEIIGVDNFICKSSADKLKIQTSNPESYRTLIHFFKDENAQYHTYQLREDKPLRIVIRNLHSSTPIKTIKEELEFRLFEVRQVTNVLHKVNKNPLPLFFVDLEPTPKSKEIFELSSLLHTKIRIEVRCGDGHQTSDCPNPRDAPPKCALCSENHPANYKGCSIYRELQRRKTPTSKSNIVTDNIRYKSPNVQSSHPPNDTLFNKPPYSDQRKSYAHVTSNQSNNHAHSSNPIPPDVDVNKIISSFLEEFKSLINPLLSLLTKRIQLQYDSQQNNKYN
ncbi:hypothetical protein AGLY_016391 [Aphis glycines]|uniref:Pre-C2HC domain-containing protein n=1 Tax=Aphis glycines TaxID=307491 RepID=A0A6G0SZ42_APHGL|nr:hypothetical protein AGLY_016391 [Aphis glycines]